MSAIANQIGRIGAHLLFQPRLRQNRAVRRFASGVPTGSRLLEFGSGKPVGGRYPYSASRFFPHCEVTMSDVNPKFGHAVVDITNPPFEAEFDCALAASVLEHVTDPEAAVAGVHRVLRPGGVAGIAFPFFYPLHDEPHDYWRFTEHTLRMLLADFSEVRIDCSGPRKAPVFYFATVIK